MPAQSLDNVPDPSRPRPGRSTSLAHVLRAWPKEWRCDIRDVLHSEAQPVRAKVVGPVMPPVHDPDASPPQRSFVLYGFFGGVRSDAWCIPVHNEQATNDEREQNAYFLKLLGITIRIGKLNASSNDIVFELVSGNVVFRLNVTTGNVLIQGSDGNTQVEIEQGGKIHAKAKAGTTVDLDDGTGAVALTKHTEMSTHVTWDTAHLHNVPMIGATGVPTVAPPSVVGTTVARGK